MHVCAQKKDKNQNKQPQYIHSINEDWYIYLTKGSQLIKNMMQLSWLYDYITAFQFHPKVKSLSVQKWVLQRSGHFPVLMCLKKNGKMVIRLELKGKSHQSNAVVWVKDHVAMTSKEYKGHEKK